jgi:transcriptional antiterminator RfaH
MDDALHPSWYCVRSKTRQEPLAAQQLRTLGREVETFCPMIRFQRKTVRGRVWFTEALFPGYLFARFDYEKSVTAVRYTTGVRGLVHFGDEIPTIPPAAIEQIARFLEERGKQPEEPAYRPGDRVEVSEGPFRGFQALVTKVMPARQRVRILIDFLGRCVESELSEEALDPVEEEDCAAASV